MYFWIRWLACNDRIQVSCYALRGGGLLEVHGLIVPGLFFRVHAVLAVIHSKSQVGKVARKRVSAGFITDRYLYALSEKLPETCAGQLRLTLLHIVIASVCFA